jgi:hypothetical protein
MESIKIESIEDLFEALNKDNIENLMFDLYKTAHCFIDLKEKHKGVKMKVFTFVDDGKHDIKFDIYENGATKNP